MSKPAPESETNLLLLLRSDSVQAFESLYKQYSKQLYWKLQKMVKDNDQADEILQDLFVRVWERRAQIDPEKPFPAYLYRIAQNMVVDYYRKLGRRSRAHAHLQSNSSELTDPFEDAISTDDRELLLQKAISSLSKQREQAFVLCKIEGKSHKEAAEIMNISPNTVHNHLVKATSAIKWYLENGEKVVPPVAVFLAIYSLG